MDKVLRISANLPIFHVQFTVIKLRILYDTNGLLVDTN